MSSQLINVNVSLVSHLVVLVYFLANIYRMYQEGGLVESKVFTLWAIVIVASVIITIFGNIFTYIGFYIARAIRTGNPEEERFVEDERDRLIGLKGDRVAYISFAIGVFLAMLAFVLGQPALVMFSLLIFFGSVSGISGDVSKLYLYRKGG